jgi:arylsulfatase A-like enzyme
MKHLLLSMLLGLGILQGRIVNFDLDDAEADVEAFPGITATGSVDLSARPRTSVAPGIWMEVTTTTSGGTAVSGHVNADGLGAVGDPGGNQLSNREVMTVSFFDAASGGNPVPITLDRIVLGAFGGTASTGINDGVIVRTPALPDLTLAGNTNATGSGWSFTQLSPNAANGTGELSFQPAISLATFTLTDNSTGTGGSRLQKISFNSNIPDPDPDPDPNPSAPNIIYIIADDMGYSDIGCYGGEIQTPNIDRLSSEGIRFRQFYNNAKCETTRSCLMSGLFHGRSGLKVENGATLAEAMRSGGYRTYAVGKWHLGSSATGGDGLTPIDRGFHHFYGIYDGASNYFPSGISENQVYNDTQESGGFISPHASSYFTQDSPNLRRQTSFPPGYYMTDGIGDHATAFITDAATNHPERPFFLYLAFNAPHTSLQAPVSLIQKYRNTYKAKGWDVMRQEKWQRQIASGLVDPKWQLSNLREDIPRWNDLDEAARDLEDHRRSVYAAMVDSMDQNIGKVLNLLDQLGVADNTLVMFCSDNGAQAFDKGTLASRQISPDSPNSPWDGGAGWASYSNTPFRYSKQSQHQGGICTPLVARWPGVIAPGRTTDEPGHVVDIMATLVDIGSANYASLTTPSGAAVPPMDGKSLLPVFNGTGRPAPDFWGFEFDKKDFAVIQGDWKLVSFRSGPWRLFNLADDRTETRNLAREYPDKVQQLATLYDQWAIDTYGSDSRTYANRRVITNLGTQSMRYLTASTGELYSQPPVAFNDSDIGNPTSSVVSEIHEVFTVGTTSAAIGGTADAFNFTSLPFFGDGEIIIRLESITGSTPAAMAGIMLRESLTPGSAFVMTGIDPAGDCAMIHRPTADAASATGGSVNLAAPAFLRLSRSGNTFTSACSGNGLQWTTLATQDLPLPANLHAGIASCSGSSTTQATFVYRELEMRDISAYPAQARLIDGIPAVLGYAIGAPPGTSSLDRLPTLQLSQASGPQFPEMVVHRRLDLTGVALGLDQSGNLGTWIDDHANWAEVTRTPHADGISERVTIRRNVDTTAAPRSFYRLRAEPE